MTPFEQALILATMPVAIGACFALFPAAWEIWDLCYRHPKRLRAAWERTEAFFEAVHAERNKDVPGLSVDYLPLLKELEEERAQRKHREQQTPEPGAETPTLPAGAAGVAVDPTGTIAVLWDIDDNGTLHVEPVLTSRPR